MSGELENVNEGERIIPTMRPIEPKKKKTTPTPQFLALLPSLVLWKNTGKERQNKFRGVVLELHKHSWETFCHLDFNESWHATTTNGFRV